MEWNVETLQHMQSLFCQSGAVKSRRYNLTVYPNTWTGKSLVDWLVSPQVRVGSSAARRRSATCCN